MTIVLATMLLATHRPATGGDWPQILGPNRNGIAVDETLAEAWPAAGPQVLWTHPVGPGFSGISVAGDAAIVFHRGDDDVEIVERLDSETGKRLWSRQFATNYVSTINSDDGPRACPVITGQRVLVFGAGGGLRCLNLKDGSVHWQVETYEKWRVPEGYFGAGSTPIVVGELVLLNLGAAREQAGIVAFRLKDGTVAWQKFEDQASYSSPILTQIDNEQCVVFVTRLNAVGVSPADGRELFSIRFGQRGPTVNGANPVVINKHLFLTASYGIGAVYGPLRNGGFEEQWRADDVCSSQYATPIAIDGALIGVDGRQDFGPVELKCFDPSTRRVFWSESGFDYGTLVRAGDKLLYLSCQGELILIRASRAGYEELARSRVQQPAPGGYRLPSLSNGRLFIRDDKTLRVLQVGEQHR